MSWRGGFFAGDPDDDPFAVGNTSRRVPVPTFVVVAVVVLAGLAGLSLVTGFPGPGALRRYPVADLNEVADRINRAAATASAGVSSNVPASDPAEVDLVASRVRVSVTADVCDAGLTHDQLEMVEWRSGDTPSCP